MPVYNRKNGRNSQLKFWEPWIQLMGQVRFHMKFLTIFNPWGFGLPDSGIQLVFSIAEEAFTWRKILQSPTVRSLFNTAGQKSEAVLLLEGPLPAMTDWWLEMWSKRICQSSANSWLNCCISFCFRCERQSPFLHFFFVTWCHKETALGGSWRIHLGIIPTSHVAKIVKTCSCWILNSAGMTINHIPCLDQHIYIYIYMFVQAKSYCWLKILKHIPFHHHIYLLCKCYSQNLLIKCPLPSSQLTVWLWTPTISW